MIKTLYLHENLEPTEERTKWNDKYILLNKICNNTHLKFLTQVSFEENWCPKEKPLTEFKIE